MVPVDHGIAIDARGSQPPGNITGRIARTDLGDVAGLPVEVCCIVRDQRKVEGRAAGTARIEVPAFDQAPGAISRRAPVGQVAAAGELADMVLPMPQRARVAGVDVDAVEQRLRAGVVQPVVQVAAEAAITVGVLAVAQCKHAVLQ